MKNLQSILLIAVVGAMSVGCYNDFDTPKPAPVYTDSLMQLQGLRKVTIKEVKDAFNTAWGGISGTGSNSSWADTKTLKLGEPSPLTYNYVATVVENGKPVQQVMTVDESTAQNLKCTSNFDDCYVKGKVISSDEEGNIYKSLYIFDGTAGIELKLHSDLFLDYHLNLTTLESQWVYVKLKDLYLGNYRMMLSLGNPPADSYNTAGTHKYYANSNIESPIAVKNIVLPGERTTLTVGSDPTSDILVVDNSNYTTLLSGAAGQAALGRLVRFTGVKIHYAGVKFVRDLSTLDTDGDGKITTADGIADVTGHWDANAGVVTNQPDGQITIDDLPAGDARVETPAAVQSGTLTNSYPTWIVTDYSQPTFSPWFRWAYHDVNQNVSLYTSVLMSLNDNATYTTSSEKGVYAIRTSGYSRFANNPIPMDGTAGNVTGIYGIYSKQSDFSGSSSDWAQYQITVSRIEDLDFPQESLLSNEWIRFNTPVAAYHPNVKESLDDYGDFE